MSSISYALAIIICAIFGGVAVALGEHGFGTFFAIMAIGMAGEYAGNRTSDTK